MKKVLLFLIGLFVIVPIVLWQISKSRTFQFFGEIIHKVETTDSIIALTFDDGPTKKTDEILSILKDCEIKATFFVNGQDIAKNMNEAKALVESGHELANHSYSHSRMILKSSEFIKNEIDSTDLMIRRAGYKGEIFFRPPFGKKLFVLPYYLSNQNRKTIMWNIEPESYNDIVNNHNEIASHVVDKAQPGSIILLHVMMNGREESLKAIKPIVNELKNKGFQFKTISEIINE